MSINSKDIDPSIVAQPYIGAHLDHEAEDVLTIPDQLMNDINFSPKGSEKLVIGLTRSDQALEKLRIFGITERQILRATRMFKVTKELVHEDSGESFPFRSIVSLAAVLAHQEVGNRSYQVGGRHLVEAIRRTPTSEAYVTLQRLAKTPNF